MFDVSLVSMWVYSDNDRLKEMCVLFILVLVRRENSLRCRIMRSSPIISVKILEKGDR